MNDPHVVALIYSIEHDNTVRYDDALPIEKKDPEFSINAKDKRVRLELKTHYATEDAALKAIGPYIRSWELEAALEGRPGQFGLRFQRSEIIDRNPSPPTPGKINVNAFPITFRFDVPNTVSVTKTSPKPYPSPPPSELKLDPDDPDVLTMFHRYQGYLEHREKLPAMAYFCLTILEKYLCRGRPKAAAKYGIDLEVLKEVGNLTANKGGPAAARKAQKEGIGNPLTMEEIRFLTQAVKAMIRRVAEVAHDPDQSRPQITKADLR